MQPVLPCVKKLKIPWNLFVCFVCSCFPFFFHPLNWREKQKIDGWTFWKAKKKETKLYANGQKISAKKKKLLDGCCSQQYIVKTAGVANIYSVVSSLAPKYNKTSRRTSHQQFECLLFVCCAVCPVAIISSFTVNLLSLSAVEFFVFFCLLLSLLIHSSLGCSGIYSWQFYL